MNEDEIEVDHDELNEIDLEHENGQGGSATEPENDNGGSHSSEDDRARGRARVDSVEPAATSTVGSTTEGAIPNRFRKHNRSEDTTVSTHAHTTRIRH